jgi:hypothetical protein
MGEMKNVYRTLVRKYQAKRAIRRSKLGWDVDIK